MHHHHPLFDANTLAACRSRPPKRTGLGREQAVEYLSHLILCAEPRNFERHCDLHMQGKSKGAKEFRADIQTDDRQTTGRQTD
ncbi:hypothetical protein V3C99_008836 [Haemonchus contortus]|uniref:Transposase n=1 Tax=Haemonchus contortus TaxID=6289 RepID=A0A7I4YL13_HAECO